MLNIIYKVTFEDTLVRADINLKRSATPFRKSNIYFQMLQRLFYSQFF